MRGVCVVEPEEDALTGVEFEREMVAVAMRNPRPPSSLHLRRRGGWLAGGAAVVPRLTGMWTSVRIGHAFGGAREGPLRPRLTCGAA